MAVSCGSTIKGTDNQCFELKDLSSDDDLTCPVCLDIFQGPKTLPCGHSFCTRCIQQLLQNTNESGIYCPTCRQRHGRIIIHQIKINFSLEYEASEYLRRNITFPTSSLGDMIPPSDLQTMIDESSLMERVSIMDEVLTQTHQQRNHISGPREQLGKDSRITLNSTISTKGIFTCELVEYVTLLSPAVVCFSSATTLYCYKILGQRKSNKILWQRDYKGITSLTSSDDLIFATQPTGKLILTEKGYSAWIILVLNWEGETIRQLPAALGQMCSVTALSSGFLAIADSGSYKHKAEPCVIIMTHTGGNRQVVKPERKYNRLIKPVSALVMPRTGQLIVFDGGDNYIKAYSRSTLNNILCWKQKIKSYITMTTRIHKPERKSTAITATEEHFLVVLVKEGVQVHHPATGELTYKIDHVWSKETPTYISLLDKRIAVSAGKTVYIYTIENGSQKISICA